MAKKTAKKKERKVQVSFMLEQKDIDLIEYYAGTMRMTRSNFVRNLVLSGLDDVNLMNSIGIMKLVKVSRKEKQIPLPIKEAFEVG